MEAYVPRMVYQEYMPEDGPCSFLEPGWEEEMLEVEAFHEPPRSLADPAQRQQSQGTTDISGADLR